MKLDSLHNIGQIATIEDDASVFVLKFCLDKPSDSNRALAVINSWQETLGLSDVGAVSLLLDLDRRYEEFWKDKL